MSEASSNTTHWAIGAILLFIGAFVVVALVLVYSQADSVDTSVNINNANPVVESLYVSNTTNGLSNDFGAGLTLVSGSAHPIHINGVVSDANGAADIDQVLLKFYRETIGFECTPDNNNCYSTPECQLSANNATSKKYDCLVNVQFYADATDAGGRHAADIWKSRVSVDDKNSGSGFLLSSGANDTEVNTLLSLDIPDSIYWDQITANNTSSTQTTNEEQVFTQKGNDEADVEVSGTPMNCDGTGSIPVGNIEWSLTDVDYGSGTDLTGSAVDTDLYVGYRENDGSDLVKGLSWNIAVPYEAVGSCTGTNTISTIAH